MSVNLLKTSLLEDSKVLDMHDPDLPLSAKEELLELNVFSESVMIKIGFVFHCSANLSPGNSPGRLPLLLLLLVFLAAIGEYLQYTHLLCTT